MNYEEEISYRNNILSSVRNGKKITQEERLWLVTHRIINRTLGYPYLNTDIIRLAPRLNHLIRIQIISVSYLNRIIPVITVPASKGKIVTNKELFDLNGNVSLKKSVKSLGLLIDTNNDKSEVFYNSDLGLLGVSYECDYFDNKQNIMVRKGSCVGDPNFAMISEVLTENKILYRCKSPTSDNFESLIFSIEIVQPIRGQSEDGSLIDNQKE